MSETETMNRPPRPKADASTILQQTNRVGKAVMQTTEEVHLARRDLAATQGTVDAIYDLIAPTGDGEGENPVLEALEQVLLALRHQSMTLETIEVRIGKIEERLRLRPSS